MRWTTLISAADLAAHFQDANWVVLDCRHELADLEAGRRAYDAGHIPGAQFAEMETRLSDKSRGPNGEFRGRHPLPEPASFIETLRAWGINADTQVIAYDAHGGVYASRLWWMLRWVGHDKVAVLDGGLSAWTAHGMPLSTEPASSASRARGNIVLNTSLERTVSAAELLSEPAKIIIDARSPDRFRGENETIDPVGGHIPGARNRFFKENLNADGRFKSAQQLRTEFAALIERPEASVMQCGSGVTACHNRLAMEIAGLPGAALYPGSWSEWCADPSRPVATGA